MKKVTSLAISLIAMIAFSAIFTSCQKSPVAQIKQDILSLNDECPLIIGDIQISSFGFDDEKNLVITNAVISDDAMFNVIQNNYASKSKIIKNFDADLINELVQNDIGMAYTYTNANNPNETKEISMTATEIKNIIDNPIPDEELILQLIENEKSTFPTKIDEGITIVDALKEGNNAIFICSIDENIYDINTLIDYLRTNKKDFKQELLADPLQKGNFKILKRANTNLIYRYIGDSSQKYIDITITPEEM